MFRTLIAFTAISLLAPLSYADEPKSDKDVMQGDWRVTSMRVRATDVDIAELGDGGYAFTDNKLKITDQGLTTICELTVRSDCDPKELDLKAVEGIGAGKTMYGIYRLQDGKLTLCIADVRPTKFSGDGEAGLLVLERVKSSE